MKGDKKSKKEKKKTPIEEEEEEEVTTSKKNNKNKRKLEEVIPEPEPEEAPEDEDEEGEEEEDVEEELAREEEDRLRRDALQYREALAKRGVVYMSRVPPFMKPNKVRTLLEPYGEITRLFLAEEDAIHRKKRKEHGGNASKQFREGWIEFADKKVAKSVALSLNNTPIGGKKGDYYHDDIWNLKYLKNFKWEFLTEELAYERRIREQKLKTALMQAKKSNAEMVQLIEKTKVQDIIKERKKQKRAAEGTSTAEDSVPRDGVDSKTIKRKFKQVKAIGKDYGENENKVDKTVLNSIFAKSKST